MRGPLFLDCCRYGKSNDSACFSTLLINDNHFSHLTLQSSTVTRKNSVFHLFNLIFQEYACSNKA